MDSDDCRRVRDRLMRSGPGTEAAAERAHLDACPECAAFARRLMLARALPAALALVLALLWIGVSQPPSPEFKDLLSESANPDLVMTYAALAPEAAP
jgi:hypothetical protein